MGIGFSSSHLLEPELYRDIPEVVERSRLFESYSEWTMDDVQKAVQRFADTHAQKRNAKLALMKEALDATRAQMDKLRPPAGAGGGKHKKKKGLFGKRQEDEGLLEDAPPPFDPVYNRLAAEHAAAAAEYAAAAAVEGEAGVANSAVMAPVGWREFYGVLSDTEERRLRTLRERERQSFHPAASGFVMERDREAAKMLAAYNGGDVERPGLEDHEIDGHTDDSASATEEDSDVRTAPAPPVCVACAACAIARVPRCRCLGPRSEPR